MTKYELTLDQIDPYRGMLPADRALTSRLLPRSWTAGRPTVSARSRSKQATNNKRIITARYLKARRGNPCIGSPTSNLRMLPRDLKFLTGTSSSHGSFLDSAYLPRHLQIQDSPCLSGTSEISYRRSRYGQPLKRPMLKSLRNPNGNLRNSQGLYLF